jgi:hypothetical protein
MLPQDVGSMIPSMPNGNGGEQLMSLPLREAREMFEREYTSSRRSTASAATFRVRRNSSAWSVRVTPQAQGARRGLMNA